jgi:GR25 family glycosyltransferase involved in LPS biosynthesis
MPVNSPVEPGCMNAYFINLAGATDRRSYLEENFRRWAPASARLTRIDAVDSQFVESSGLTGRIRSTEIACLLSHRRAIAASLEEPQHSLIVEDDALFGPSTFAMLPTIPQLQDDSTDLVFLSGMLGDLGSLVGHILLRRVLLKDSRIATVDLANVPLSGADAYIVKRQAKDKLLMLIDQVRAYDTPYDLLLRNWVHSRALRAVLVFPFLTMLSPMAEASTNGNGNETMSTYIAFRRLLAIDSQHYPGDIMASIDRIDPSFYDNEANDLAKAFRCLLSRKFVFG